MLIYYLDTKFNRFSNTINLQWEQKQLYKRLVYTFWGRERRFEWGKLKNFLVNSVAQLIAQVLWSHLIVNFLKTPYDDPLPEDHS